MGCPTRICVLPQIPFPRSLPVDLGEASLPKVRCSTPWKVRCGVLYSLPTCQARMLPREHSTRRGFSAEELSNVATSSCHPTSREEADQNKSRTFVQQKAEETRRSSDDVFVFPALNCWFLCLAATLAVIPLTRLFQVQS